MIPFDLAGMIESMMQDLKGPVDPYKKYAPVIKTDDGYAIYLTDDIAEPAMYNEVIQTLRTVGTKDTVRIYISSNGGDAASAELLYSTIKESKAQTVAIASGTVASAASIICLACDKHEISPNAVFLIHEGSAGFRGKPSDVRSYQEFTTRHLKKFFAEVYSGVLAETELSSALAGVELWLTGQEITDRLTASFKPASS